jgi:hypothetical protein
MEQSDHRLSCHSHKAWYALCTVASNFSLNSLQKGGKLPFKPTQKCETTHSSLHLSFSPPMPSVSSRMWMLTAPRLAERSSPSVLDTCVEGFGYFGQDSGNKKLHSAQHVV